MENNGRVKKGQVLNPNGRPKGSKNKATTEIRERFKNFVENHIEDLDKHFNDLEPKDKFKFIIDISKFVLPTLKSIEQGDILENLSNEDFEKLVERIKQEYEKKEPQAGNR